MANNNQSFASLDIEGLPEFVKAVARIAPEAKGNLVKAVKTSAEIVAQDARGRVRRRSGRAANSIKVKATGKAVGIVGGGGKAPYYPWLDFGGTVGKGRRSQATLTFSAGAKGRVRVTAQVTRERGTGSVVRPFIKGGRYLFVALSAKNAAMREALTGAIEDAVRDAGLEVSGR